MFSFTLPYVNRLGGGGGGVELGQATKVEGIITDSGLYKYCISTD